MSNFEWFQCLFNLVFTGGILFLVHRNLLIRHEMKQSQNETETDVKDLETLFIRVRQNEIDTKKYYEMSVQEVQKVDEKVSILSKEMQENLSFSSPNSQEARELKALSSEKEEIPTLRQIERTKARLNQEIHVDLRTLLREQLA